MHKTWKKEWNKQKEPQTLTDRHKYTHTNILPLMIYFYLKQKQEKNAKKNIWKDILVKFVHFNFYNIFREIKKVKEMRKNMMMKGSERKHLLNFKYNFFEIFLKNKTILCFFTIISFYPPVLFSDIF